MYSKKKSDFSGFFFHLKKEYETGKIFEKNEIYLSKKYWFYLAGKLLKRLLKFCLLFWNKLGAISSPRFTTLAGALCHLVSLVGSFLLIRTSVPCFPLFSDFWKYLLKYMPIKCSIYLVYKFYVNMFLNFCWTNHI